MAEGTAPLFNNERTGERLPLSRAASNASFFFDSGQQTITSAGSLSLAHGFSGLPKQVGAVLQCVASENNYNTGDELVIDVLARADSGTGKGIAIVPTATALRLRFGSNANVFNAIDFSSGAVVQLTNANWKLVVRAWNYR